MDDQQAIDIIATILGTSETWSGADFLELIANVIGEVRPHPGGAFETYRADFLAATGREVVARYDATDS